MSTYNNIITMGDIIILILFIILMLSISVIMKYLDNQ